jgi:hypothetical protein
MSLLLLKVPLHYEWNNAVTIAASAYETEENI